LEELWVLTSISDASSGQKTVLLEWVEPEVRVLPVTETAFNPGPGGADGGAFDCTLS